MLRLHRGVRFVSGSGQPVTRRAPGLDVTRQMDVAARLRAAIGVGDVTDIHELAGVLMRGTPAESALGERINRLVSEFDFTGLAELVETLAGTGRQ